MQRSDNYSSCSAWAGGHAYYEQSAAGDAGVCAGPLKEAKKDCRTAQELRLKAAKMELVVQIV